MRFDYNVVPCTLKIVDGVKGFEAHDWIKAVQEIQNDMNNEIEGLQRDVIFSNRLSADVVWTLTKCGNWIDTDGTIYSRYNFITSDDNLYQHLVYRYDTFKYKYESHNWNNY